MTRDELYQYFDGGLLDDDRQRVRYETVQIYQQAFVQTAAQNFTRRLHHLLQCVCGLRRKGKLHLKNYTTDIIQMRHKAREAQDLLV